MEVWEELGENLVKQMEPLEGTGGIGGNKGCDERPLEGTWCDMEQSGRNNGWKE